MCWINMRIEHKTESMKKKTKRIANCIELLINFDKTRSAVSWDGIQWEKQWPVIDVCFCLLSQRWETDVWNRLECDRPMHITFYVDDVYLIAIDN